MENMFRIEIGQGDHDVECGYCGKREFVKGPFVGGLQTPASVQHALRWHYSPQILFSGHEVCSERGSWSDGEWIVIGRSSGELIDRGRFALADQQPVVDPSIETEIGGLDWDSRRVKELAAEEIAASKTPDRKWSMVADRNPRAVFVRRDGQGAELLFPREDIHVEKIDDDEIRHRVRLALLNLEAQGQ
jgi:hypothetical protein